jgi:WD40 repeat protein
LCVRSFNEYILTGTEEGNLYLWYNFEVIDHILEAHKAAVRCIEVDKVNDILFSGGKDGTVLFLKIENNRLTSFNDANLSTWHKYQY